MKTMYEFIKIYSVLSSKKSLKNFNKNVYICGEVVQVRSE